MSPSGSDGGWENEDTGSAVTYGVTIEKPEHVHQSAFQDIIHSLVIPCPCAFQVREGARGTARAAVTGLLRIVWQLRNGLMGGYGNGTFGPNNNLSRAQFAQILFNKEGRPVVNYLLQYGDVATGAWYTEAVRWAAGTSKTS